MTKHKWQGVHIAAEMCCQLLVALSTSACFCHRDGNALLDDLWVFDLDTQTWQLASPIGNGPSARQGHTMASIDSQVCHGVPTQLSISQIIVNDTILHQLLPMFAMVS